MSLVVILSARLDGSSYIYILRCPAGQEAKESYNDNNSSLLRHFIPRKDILKTVFKKFLNNNIINKLRVTRTLKYVPEYTNKCTKVLNTTWDVNYCRPATQSS